MTAAQKASELIDTFWKLGGFFPVTTYAHAKQCAIICVEEIIKVTLYYTDNLDPDWQYWQQVKEAIEKA